MVKKSTAFPGVSPEYREAYVAARGRKRNPTDWTYVNLPATPTWLYRGYTGHEHVEPFALINMNGRMYDPLNGRMLSADNYVQGGLGTQGYNRYSYAGNNPLLYTDPSGESIFTFFKEVVKGAAIFVAVLVVPTAFVVGFGLAGSLFGMGGTVAGVILGATIGIYVYSFYVAPWINGW